MIRTITIADLHGRDYFIYEDFDNYDLIIFLGDYVDSYDLNNYIILQTLERVLELKEKYGDKVILLWGNHDIHYLFNGKYECSGFREEMLPDLYKIFNDNKHHFKLAHQVKNYLWTHAGVHRGFYNQYIAPKVQEGETLADTLNRLFDEEYEPIFHCGVWRSGKKPVGGPLWLDKNEMGTKPVMGYHQIVGHTNNIKTTNNIKYQKYFDKKKLIQRIDNFKGNDTSITYCDNDNQENYELIIKN